MLLGRWLFRGILGFSNSGLIASALPDATDVQRSWLVHPSPGQGAYLKLNRCYLRTRVHWRNNKGLGCSSVHGEPTWSWVKPWDQAPATKREKTSNKMSLTSSNVHVIHKRKKKEDGIFGSQWNKGLERWLSSWAPTAASEDQHSIPSMHMVA